MNHLFLIPARGGSKGFSLAILVPLPSIPLGAALGQGCH